MKDISQSLQPNRHSSQMSESLDWQCDCGQNQNLSAQDQTISHFESCEIFQAQNQCQLNTIGNLFSQVYTYEDLKVIELSFKQMLQQKKTCFKKNDLGTYELDWECAKTKDDDFYTCIYCKQNFTSDPEAMFFPECTHVYCKPCIQGLINDSFRDFKVWPNCDECYTNFSDTEIKEMIGDAQADDYMKEFIIPDGAMQAKCANCEIVFEFESGDITKGGVISKNRDGEDLTQAQQAFYAENRFKCPSCSTEQCRQCGVIPFHTGLTCDQAHNQVVCRYCKDPLDNPPNLFENPMSDICLNPECCAKYDRACKKI